MREGRSEGGRKRRKEGWRDTEKEIEGEKCEKGRRKGMKATKEMKK